MSTKFSDFMEEIEAEAKAEGPSGEARLETLRQYFRGRLPNGTLTDYLAFHAQPSLRQAAVMVIRGPQGFLAVTRRNSERFGLPGGKVDPGETNLQAAIREAQEETGLSITKAEALFSQDDGEFMTHCFLATEWSGEAREVEPGIKPVWNKAEEMYGPNSAFPIYNREAMRRVVKRDEESSKEDR